MKLRRLQTLPLVFGAALFLTACPDDDGLEDGLEETGEEIEETTEEAGDEMEEAIEDE